ncbi:MAG TPA: biopolymer transporter ExbD [Halothiobacillaceae bacterium]|nr:biopolymer transporter ExbD [Halothiobacillaceae bacterium]
MSFGRMGEKQEPMSEMNVIPLVDIMLVLLVVFIVTAPVVTHSVVIQLPQATSEPTEDVPDQHTIAVDAEGRLYLDDQPTSFDQLARRLAETYLHNPEVAVFVRADETTQYAEIAKIMSTVRNAGISRLGFESRPE